MTATFNMKFLLLILATCVAFITLGYFSPVLGLTLIVLVLSFYRATPGKQSEAFEDAPQTDESLSEFWGVRFQNKVMFYNAPCFLRSNYKQNLVGTNCSVTDLQRLPVAFSWENFVIDDARMGYGAYRGNVNRLQYGKPFYLQSQSRNNEIQTYVTFLENKLQVTDKRDSNSQFVLLPTVGNKNMYVEFGDTVYIQHKNTGNYITVDKYSNDSLKMTKEQNKNSEWRILNQLAYGKNIDVDWARESWASQSSLYQGSKYPASNCTDGDPNTFCHTDEVNDVKSPYFELHLPRLIEIQRVKILNRQDCCKDRLGKFYVIIFFDRIDQDQQKLVSTEVYKKECLANANDNEFVLADINKVGNRVRVQLADTGAKRILNLATVSVFGNPILLGQAGAAGKNDTATGRSDLSQFLLFKPTEIFSQLVLPISPALGNNFGVHFQINVFENVEERPLLQMDQFSIHLLPGGGLSVIYTLDGGEKREFSSKGALRPGQSSHVAVQVYNGLTEQNGWKRVKLAAGGNFLLLNVQEQKYFTVHSVVDKSSYPEAQVPLEQFEFVAAIPEGKEEKPFIRLFINKKIDTEKTETKWITNSAKGTGLFSTLVLSPFNGLIGPLRLTNLYYLSNLFADILSFEQTAVLGNFKIDQNKKIGTAKLPSFYRVGATVSFWLYITTNSNLQRYCILRQGNNFSIQLDYLNNALHFNFAVSDPKTKQKTPLLLDVPVNYTVIPFGLNHFAAVVDNLKGVVRIYQNGEQVGSKRAAGIIGLENHQGLEIGGDCGTPDLSAALSGQILDLRVSNYPETKGKILEIVQDKSLTVKNSKDTTIRDVNALFQKAGCPAKLIDQQLQNPELSQMYLSMYSRDPKVLGSNFAAIKKMADEVIFNRQFDGNLTGEKLELVRLCYGEPTSNVVKRLYKINQEIFQLKESGNVTLPLLSGQVSGLSSTVVGPKMMQTNNLDNVVINFDLYINSLGSRTMQLEAFEGSIPTRPSRVEERNILALKFIQGRKHAYVPQLYVIPITNRLAMDVFTTEGIETVEIQTEIPLRTTHLVSIAFQKGHEVNFFINSELVETRQMLGRIMVSNIFEALIGPTDGLGGFDGWLSNLSVSYNRLYALSQRTRSLIKEVSALDGPKKVPEQYLQNMEGNSFTVHGWFLYKSSNRVNKCNMVQGIISNTFFKVCVNEAQNALSFYVGENNYLVKLPNYFYNQWNYLSFEFDQSGEFTVLSFSLNAKLLETIETNNEVIKERLPEDKSVVLLGECKNTFVKELKLSNYTPNQSQIIDFMNNNRAGTLIDSDSLSLFDFEKDIQALRKELSVLKGRRAEERFDLSERTDATIKEKCFVIENKWNNFKSKNISRTNLSRA